MALIEYRKLNSEDAAEFKNLRIEAATESPASFHPDADELRDRHISDFRIEIAPSQLQSVYGAFDNDYLVGIAGLRRDAMKKKSGTEPLFGASTPKPPIEDRELHES